MKTFFTIVVNILIFAPFYTISQSVISSGGFSVQNSSVMISFTIGEVFIGDLLNNDLNVSMGFQQPGVNNSNIPEFRSINNFTLENDETICFDALNTISVTDLTVQQQATLTLIAGETIKIHPSSIVAHGGNFHAYISNDFCNNPEVDQSETMITSSFPSSFKVYPNPFTESFIVEIESQDNNSRSSVELYDLFGKKIDCYLQIDKYKTFNNIRIPKGVYIIRVINGNTIEVKKLIKK